MNHIVHALVSLLDHYGYAAVFVLSLLGSACIPIPSEIVMLYGGYLAYHHHDHVGTFVGVVLAGLVGNVVGSWVAWWIGLRMGREWLEKPGHRLIHVSPRQLAMADRWFERRGPLTVLVMRMVPLARAFISLPAGVARMPFWQFTIYTVIGSIPWVAGLAWLGYALGPHWEQAHGVMRYGDYVVVAALVAVVAWLVVKRRRGVTVSVSGD
jgi:membrane protein DedA with SNARE-associated domain